MAIAIQFLSVILPIRNIIDIRNRGAFAPSPPLTGIPPAADKLADSSSDTPDWFAEPDEAQAILLFRQRWLRRAFRPEGGYFIGGCGTEWYDGHLYCNTFMNSIDADDEIESWARFGLTPFVDVDGARKWQDLCVAATRRGLKYPCDWFEYNIDQNYAWLRGTTPGAVVGRTDNYESWLDMHRDGVSDSDL